MDRTELRKTKEKKRRINIWIGAEISIWHIIFQWDGTCPVDQPFSPVFQRNNLLKSQWFGKRKSASLRSLTEHSPVLPACLHSREGSQLGFQGKWEELKYSAPMELSIPTAPKNLPGHRAQTFAGSSLTVKEMPTARDEAWHAIRWLHNLGSAYKAVTALSYFW